MNAPLSSSFIAASCVTFLLVINTTLNGQQRMTFGIPSLEERMQDNALAAPKRPPPPENLPIKPPPTIRPDQRVLDNLEISINESAARGLQVVPGFWIVIFREDIFPYAAHLGSLGHHLIDREGKTLNQRASELVSALGGELVSTYNSALGGFAALLSSEQARTLSESPEIRSVTANRIGPGRDHPLLRPLPDLDRIAAARKVWMDLPESIAPFLKSRAADSVEQREAVLREVEREMAAFRARHPQLGPVVSWEVEFPLLQEALRRLEIDYDDEAFVILTDSLSGDLAEITWDEPKIIGDTLVFRRFTRAGSGFAAGYPRYYTLAVKKSEIKAVELWVHDQRRISVTISP